MPIIRDIVEIDKIDCGERVRKDLGDINALAASIREVGLLQPVVIDSGMKLIAGRRRLEACKQLGWEQIDTFTAVSVDTLLKHAQAENDENTCRKDFTPEEAVRMGQRIEGAIAAMNKEAKKKAAAKGGMKSGETRRGESKQGANCPKAKRDETNRTRDQVASTVGMKPRSYEKAKAVVDSGNVQAIEQMNKTGKVDPAFRAVKREEKKTALRKKAAEVADKIEKPKWHIALGDCLKELPQIHGARLIVADPPYNIGLDYGDDGIEDDLDEDEYLRWCKQWINLCAGALSDDGSLWVIINDEWAEHFALMLNEAGLHRRAWIKWYETFGINCVNNFNRCSRHIFYYVVDPKRFVFNAESRYIRRPSDRQAKYNDQRADPDGKLWDDVWTIPRLVDNAAERIPDFPTQIPLAITRAIVACASEPGDLVVDPFCGSASTGHAALELHRRFTGIEIGERFWELATVRLAGVTPCAPAAL
jgi:site-specific DNA-methyltransferase (adenine-specific)